MSALLDAIRAEITPLEARLETLREIERLAGQLDGEATIHEPAAETKPKVPLLPVRETKAKPAPKRTAPARLKATTAGRDGLSAGAQAVLEGVRAGGGQWLTKDEITAVSGVQRLKDHLPRLVERGLVEVQGTTRDRRYRARSLNTGTARAQGSHQPNGGAPTARIDQGAAAVGLRDRVLQAITAKQGDLDDHAIARKLDVPVEQVATAAAQLHAAGRIWALPGGAWALGPGPRDEEAAA